MDKTKFLLNKIRTLIKYIKVHEHKIMMKKNVKNEIVFKMHEIWLEAQRTHTNVIFRIVNFFSSLHLIFLAQVSLNYKNH